MRVIEHWFYGTILMELVLGVKFFSGQFFEAAIDRTRSTDSKSMDPVTRLLSILNSSHSPGALRQQRMLKIPGRALRQAQGALSELKSVLLIGRTRNIVTA
jgi:hypothetical protein